ncbi:hypothetical protein BP6252_13951 [Coleophoma cylindrospora]|uniref:Rhodopsin domain-containing protein n=1 Tax=Coleophoma cylindrospora TaxID=1849047 RepID=A0A3D8Q501_9HELO|nr:hypothetical protein BP6252_13951 [Coleophoma cylindrospora]
MSGTFTLTVRQLATESSIWYASVLITVTMRYWSQGILRKTRPWKRLSEDDWLMLFLMCTYTIVLVLNVLYQNLDFNSETYARQAGTFNLVIETLDITTLWGIKASLLIVYNRITELLDHNRAVHLGILPFSQYFVAEPVDPVCYTWEPYNILELVADTSSDLVILMIPVSLIVKSRMPWQRKVMLSGVFGLGLFVVVAAALTKYFLFSQADSSIWVLWYAREVSMAMLVGNIYLCLPFLRKLFGNSFVGSTLNGSKQFSWNSETKYGQSVPLEV